MIIYKLELYSFLIYLYFYNYIYSYILTETIFKIILINIFGNLIMYYIFNNSIITLITHSYWRYNLNEIAIPQLINCLVNIYVTDNYMYIPINILTFLICTINRIFI
jgi:hypothetical protein